MRKPKIWPFLVALVGLVALTKLRRHHHSYKASPPDPDKDRSRPGEWRWDAW